MEQLPHIQTLTLEATPQTFKVQLNPEVLLLTFSTSGHCPYLKTFSTWRALK